MADNQQNNPQKNFQDIKKEADKLNKELKGLGGEYYKDLNSAMSGMANNLEDAQKFVNKLKENVSDLKNVFQNISLTIKNTLDDIEGMDKVSGKIKGNYKDLESLASKLQRHKEDENILTVKEIQNLKKKAQATVDNLKANQKAAEAEIDRLQKKEKLTKSEQTELSKLISYNSEITQGLADQEGYLNNIVSLTEKEVENEKKIQKALGLTGFAFKSIQGALEKIGIQSKYFEDVSKKLRETAKETGSAWKVLGTGISETFKGIGTALADPLTQVLLIGKAVKSLISLGMEYSHTVSETGKAYGLAADGAKAMVDYTRDLAANSHTVFGTQKNMLDAQNQLNESMGTSALMSGELVEGQVELVHHLGLQADEAAKISEYSVLQGKTQEEVLKGITGQNKGLLNNKKIIAEVAKTEGQLAAFYKNDPKLIGAAVIQAQKLGLTLEKTKGISDALLDIESSLANEYEAEMLIGKDLNLNQARFLAMQGDTAGAAAEVLKNIKGSAEFTQMNKVQQDALAKSLGMSSDELANSLVKQEKLSKIGTNQRNELAKLRKEGKGKLADDIEAGIVQGKSFELSKMQVSSQEKLEASVQKMKDGFSSLMAGPMGAFVDGLATAASWVGKIFSWLGKIPGAGTLGTLIGVVVGAASLIAGGLFIYKSISGTINNVKDILNKKKKHDGTSRDQASFVNVVNEGAGGGGDEGYGGGGRGKGKRGKKGRKARGRGRRRGRGLGGLLTSTAGSMALGAGMDMMMGDEDGGGMADMGMDLAADAMGGGGGGGKGAGVAKAGAKTASSVASSATKGGGGFFGKMFSGIGKGASWLWGGVKKVANKLNPLTYLKKLFTGNGLKKVLKSLPKIGTLANIALQAYQLYQTGADAASMKEQGLTYQDIGKEVVKSVGDLGGSILGGIAGTALGPVGSLLGSVLGGLGGSALAGLIADHTDVSGIGKEVVDLFGSSKGDTTALAKGGIVTGPINAVVGEAGNEAVVPLKEFYAKIDELIAAVRQGGNIYLDGAVVSTKLQSPMAIATRRTG